MSGDQLRRAADAAEQRARATYTLDEASDAVAALLRAVAAWPRPNSLHYETPRCRRRVPWLRTG